MTTLKRDKLAHEFAMAPLGENGRLVFELSSASSAQEMFPEAVAAGNGFRAGWNACDRERNSAREEVERLKKLLAEANAELEKYKNSRFELEQRAMGLSDSAC
jgi:flagellar biosynthesis/type III secretory pathway protein FliH